jgi:predicted nucleic acid-binding protein
MKDKGFIDTNVLVYLYLLTEDLKNKQVIENNLMIINIFSH